jgi:hypothetical protein
VVQVYKEMCERSGGRAGQRKAYTPGEQSTPKPQWNSHEQGVLRYEGSSGPTATNGPLKVNGLVKKVCVPALFDVDIEILTVSSDDHCDHRWL